MKTIEQCGCTHNGRAWLSKCEPHAREDHKIAARWAAEHFVNSPGTAFTPEYLQLVAEHKGAAP